VHMKFSVAYVEAETAVGASSGTPWLLSQVAMLTSKLNGLIRDLDERIASANRLETERSRMHVQASDTRTRENEQSFV